MEQVQLPSRRSFVIVIWPVLQTGAPPHWRGALETLAGQRFYFHTLAGLNRLMHEIGGWQELPEQTLSDNET